MAIHIRRRQLIVTLGSVAAWPLAARAQQVKAATIGLLGTGSAAAQSQWTAALVQRMRELGWVEGNNLAIEYRCAEGRTERLNDVASENPIQLTRGQRQITTSSPHDVAIGLACCATASSRDSRCKPRCWCCGISSTFFGGARHDFDVARFFQDIDRRLAHHEPARRHRAARAAPPLCPDIILGKDRMKF